MPKLNIHSIHLIYGDNEVATANPKRLYVDWTRDVNNVQVDRPDARAYQIDPGASLTLFSGARSLATDVTTAFDLSINPVNSSTYRLTFTGGTNPVFRTARSITVSGAQIAVAINNNATATMTLSVGIFGGVVQVGDSVFIPGAASGDGSSPFNPANTGFWQVIGVAGSTLTLVRPAGQGFGGVAETAVITNNSQFQAFSAAGVQVGDNLEVTAGFSSVTQNSYSNTAVTAGWIEFLSTMPLPLETGITPGVSGIAIYTDAKRFYRVEVDQEAVVRRNGDTGNTNRASPRIPGDADSMGWNEAWGPTWQLVVVNRSASSPMVVNLISVE